MRKILMLPIMLILLIAAVLTVVTWAFESHGTTIDVKGTRLYRLLKPFGLAAWVTTLVAALAYIPLASIQFDDGILTIGHPQNRQHTDAAGPGHQPQHRPTTSEQPAST